MTPSQDEGFPARDLNGVSWWSTNIITMGFGAKIPGGQTYLHLGSGWPIRMPQLRFFERSKVVLQPFQKPHVSPVKSIFCSGPRFVGTNPYLLGFTATEENIINQQLQTRISSNIPIFGCTLSRSILHAIQWGCLKVLPMMLNTGMIDIILIVTGPGNFMQL